MSSTHQVSGIRRVGAAALVLAVTSRVASILLWPPDADSSHARMLAGAASHPSRWAAATAVETVAWVAAGFAVLVTIPLVRGRGRVTTQLGGWVYGASLLTLGLVGAAMNSVTGTLAGEPDRAAMVKVQDHVGSPTLTALVALVLVGELFVVPYAVGLHRARLVGRWYVGAAVLAILGYVATADSSDHLVVLAGFVPLAATLLALVPVLTDRRRVAAGVPSQLAPSPAG